MRPNVLTEDLVRCPSGRHVWQERSFLFRPCRDVPGLHPLLASLFFTRVIELNFPSDSFTPSALVTIDAFLFLLSFPLLALEGPQIPSLDFSSSQM